MTDLKKRYGILKTFFHEPTLEALVALSAPERRFAYYMYRASLSGYQTTLDQFTQYAEFIRGVGVLVKENKDHPKYDQLVEWWVFLFANYGTYFLRGHIDNKHTPTSLGIDLTYADIMGMKYSDGLDGRGEECIAYFFRDDYKPSLTVDGDIGASSGNFYSPTMTEALYGTLSAEEKLRLNVRWVRGDDGKIKAIPYTVQTILGLAGVVMWAGKARDLAAENPDIWGEHMTKSLDLLIESFRTGDEAAFKESQRHWTLNKSRVDYCMGFIERYDDPMQHVGTFQADVTVAAGEMNSLLAKLQSFEERFDFPPEYKREDMSSIPNATSRHKVVGVGGCGPMLSAIAYCLPNYADLRSECGSKQVMYTLPTPSDAKRYQDMYVDAESVAFYDAVSPDMKIDDAVYELLTTLHETIGHGSGSLHGVTEAEKGENTGKWRSALEEMRAEILALYTALIFYDEIAETGALGDWPQRVEKEAMQKLIIMDMLDRGWGGWGAVPAGLTEVVQAHQVANTAIMFYVIEHATGVDLRKETIQFEGEDLEVFRLYVADVPSVVAAVTQMAKKVQHMASTADASEVDEFMLRYGASTRDPENSGIVRGMSNAYKTGVKGALQLFPEWEEINGEMVPKRPTSPLSALLNTWDLIYE
jgi:hypothetical protein